MKLESKEDYEYFDWLCNLIYTGRFPERISFEKLLKQLYTSDFSYVIRNDSNRAADGVDLRYRFAASKGYCNEPKNLHGCCSVLEMMIALSIRCEENMMDNPNIGNRTAQWFWGMITNIGLGNMIDCDYSEEYVSYRINRLLKRTYDPDGKGGLFTIRNTKSDLRKIEIWDQLNWYLDNLV